MQELSDQEIDLVNGGVNMQRFAVGIALVGIGAVAVGVALVAAPAAAVGLAIGGAVTTGGGGWLMSVA